MAPKRACYRCCEMHWAQDEADSFTWKPQCCVTNFFVDQDSFCPEFKAIKQCLNCVNWHEEETEDTAYCPVEKEITIFDYACNGFKCINFITQEEPK